MASTFSLVNICLDKHLQSADFFFLFGGFFTSNWREDWENLEFHLLKLLPNITSENHFTSSPMLPLTCKTTYPQFKHVGLGHCAGRPIIRDWVQFYRLVKAKSITVRKIHTIVWMTMMMCSAAYICANKLWWLRPRLHDSTLDFYLVTLTWSMCSIFHQNSVTVSTLMRKVKETYVVKLSQLRQKARTTDSPATTINTTSNGENSLC